MCTPPLQWRKRRASAPLTTAKPNVHPPDRARSAPCVFRQSVPGAELRIHLRQVQLAVGKSEGEAAKTHIHLRSAQRGHAFHETPVSVWIVPTQARAHGYGDVDVGAPPMSPSRGQRRAAAKPPCRAAGADWPNQLVECAMHALEQCVGGRGQPQCFQRPCSIALARSTGCIACPLGFGEAVQQLAEPVVPSLGAMQRRR